MTTFEFISHPIWLEKRIARFEAQILDSWPISFFGCRRYRLRAPDQSILAYEAPAFCFRLEREVTDLEYHYLVGILSGYFQKRVGRGFQRHIRKERDGVSYIYPILEDGQPCYMDRHQVLVLGIGVGPWLGYGLVSADARAKLAAAALGLPSFSIQGIEVFELKLLNILDPLELRAKLAGLAAWLDFYQATGLVALKQTLQWPAKLWLASELARVWGSTVQDVIEMPAEPSTESPLLSEPPAQLGYFSFGPEAVELGLASGCLFKSWLETSLGRILEDVAPVINLVGVDRSRAQIEAAWRRCLLFNPALATQPASYQIHSDGSLSLPAYQPQDYFHFRTALLQPATPEVPEPLPVQAPILIGQVVYQEGEWALDFGDSGIRSLYRLRVAPEAEPVAVTRQLQQGWINGRYITSWGRYLYTQRQMVSIWMVGAEREFGDVGDLVTELGLT